MNTFTIPDYFADAGSSDIFLHNYQTSLPSAKNKVFLSKNLFSFLIEGEKEIFAGDRKVKIDREQFLLLPSGNCLMTENLSVNQQYQSLLFFFSDSFLSEFWVKYSSLVNLPQNTDAAPFLTFRYDDFLRNYVQTLTYLHGSKNAVSEAIIRLKLEEILLYLLQHYPEQLQAFFVSHPKSIEEVELRKIVESNVLNNLEVEELAFLCNMSLSTFKRRFLEIFGTSPGKWFLQKRLEQAAFLMQHQHERASEVYSKVGFENFSSFIQSFKQKYGKTPKVFQQEFLNV